MGLNSPLSLRWPNARHDWSSGNADEPGGRHTVERGWAHARAHPAADDRGPEYVRRWLDLLARHRQRPRRYSRTAAGNGLLKLLRRRNACSRRQPRGTVRPRPTICARAGDLRRVDPVLWLALSAIFSVHRRRAGPDALRRRTRCVAGRDTRLLSTGDPRNPCNIHAATSSGRSPRFSERTGAPRSTLVASGHWRAFSAAVATVAFLVAAATLVFGWDVWQAFLESTRFTRLVVLEQGDPGWYKMQSVFAWARMWGAPIPLAYALQGVVVACLVAALIGLWRSPTSYSLKAAALCLATIQATPFTFDYDMMLLAPAIAFLPRTVSRAVSILGRKPRSPCSGLRRLSLALSHK